MTDLGYTLISLAKPLLEKCHLLSAPLQNSSCGTPGLASTGTKSLRVPITQAHVLPSIHNRSFPKQPTFLLSSTYQF